MKKLLSSLIIVVFVLSVPLSASAQEITPYWAHTASITYSLNISNNVASIDCSVRANTDMTSTEILVRLQRNDGGWSTINTFSKGSPSFYCLLGEKETVTKGYQYRIWVTYKVYKNGVLKETISDIYYYANNY